MRSYVMKLCEMKRQAALLALCLALMAVLPACSQKPAAEIEPSEEAAAEIEKWHYDGDAYFTAAEKNEVVTVHADASGQVKETDVAVSLKGVIEDGERKGALRELSNLTDITNKNGDEEFEQKDKYIFFQDSGKDVSYEGKSKAELPIKLSVKYFLDGEEMSPAEITGKKGHVRVNYKFENTEQAEIETGAGVRNVYAPFAVITLVMPEKGTYSNLETNNCELSGFESEEVIMALTMPGMEKNLEHLSMDTSDLDIHDSFSFEFDTDSFELGFSTSIVSTGLMDEEINLAELSDLRGSLGDLKSAGKELANAGSDVEDGMSDFEDYLTKYTEGAGSLDEGAGELLKYIDGMEEKLKVLSESSGGASPEIAEISKGLTGIKEGVSKLKEGSGALSTQGDSLLKGYESLKSGVSKYSGAVDTFYKEGICELYNEGVSKLNDIENFVRMMEEADDLYTTFTGLDEGQKGSVTFIIETEKI